MATIPADDNTANDDPRPPSWYSEINYQGPTLPPEEATSTLTRRVIPYVCPSGHPHILIFQCTYNSTLAPINPDVDEGLKEEYEKQPCRKPDTVMRLWGGGCQRTCSISPGGDIVPRPSLAIRAVRTSVQGELTGAIPSGPRCDDGNTAGRGGAFPGRSEDILLRLWLTAETMGRLCTPHP